jgi:hypothetical protein
MRSLLLGAIVICIGQACFAQQTKFDSLLQCGEDNFAQAKNRNDYSDAITCLEAALKLQPKNQEALYYLGYAHSRQDAFDATDLLSVGANETRKNAGYFEQIIQINPKYSGKIISQGPYAKIGAEWGSLAMRYVHDNNIDSAKWAFDQARKLGIYSDFVLNYNEQLLNTCTHNAILFVCGDIVTFPILYLQYIKKVRTDVTVIDVTLLNTVWYPRFLKRRGVHISLSGTELDSLNYSEWQDSAISIPMKNKNTNVEWTMKPSYLGNYVLRGDRLLLDIVAENKFEKDVFFETSASADTEYNLSIPNINFRNYFLINRLDTNNSQPANLLDIIGNLNYAVIKKTNFDVDIDAAHLLNTIRYKYLVTVDELKRDGELKKAQQLYSLFKERLGPDIYPYDEGIKNSVNYVEEELKK